MSVRTFYFGICVYMQRDTRVCDRERYAQHLEQKLQKRFKKVLWGISHLDCWNAQLKQKRTAHYFCSTNGQKAGSRIFRTPTTEM